jgi:hypothetical protein
MCLVSLVVWFFLAAPCFLSGHIFSRSAAGLRRRRLSSWLFFGALGSRAAAVRELDSLLLLTPFSSRARVPSHRRRPGRALVSRARIDVLPSFRKCVGFGLCFL